MTFTSDVPMCLMLQTNTTIYWNFYQNKLQDIMFPQERGHLQVISLHKSKLHFHIDVRVLVLRSQSLVNYT